MQKCFKNQILEGKLADKHQFLPMSVQLKQQPDQVLPKIILTA
jgi:hypothetical protein